MSARVFHSLFVPSFTIIEKITCLKQALRLKKQNLKMKLYLQHHTDLTEHRQSHFEEEALINSQASGSSLSWVADWQQHSSPSLLAIVPVDLSLECCLLWIELIRLNPITFLIQIGLNQIFFNQSKSFN